MTAITALNVRLGMDASNFSAGADLARAEVNKVAATMRQSTPPAEKFKKDVDLLNKAFSESGRQTKEYTQALEFLRKKYGQVDPTAKKTNGAIDQLKQSMMGAVPGGGMLANALKGPAGAMLALGAAATVAIRGMSEAATRIDQTAKAAKTAGVAFGELVAIQMLAAESTGVDAAVVNKGVRELSKRLAEARINGGALSDVLKASGSSAAELASMAPADAFKAVADIVASIPDKAEQIRIATLAIGEEGAQLVEMFRLGGGAIDAMRQEAERLGAVLSDSQVVEIESMNDAFSRVKMSIQGIWNSLLSQLAPTLTNIAKLASDFFVMVRKTNEAYVAMHPAVSAISFLVNKMLEGFRAIVAVVSDTISLILSIPGAIFGGGELNTSFSESNRLLDEMDAKANGVAAATQQATDAAEALAIEAERAAEAARQQEATYQKRLQDLQIESVALTGNVELAERMRLAAEGYSRAQIDTIMALQAQNAEIAERIKKEEEAAKKREADAEKAKKDREKEIADALSDIEKLEKAFEIEVESALKSAKDFFAQERQRDEARRDAVSAGPSSIEAGSSEAAKFMADQVNQRIGAAVVPEKPTPGEAEIAKKTHELLIAQRQANQAQQEELRTMIRVIDAIENHATRRVR